jgi:hypothetical protein
VYANIPEGEASKSSSTSISSFLVTVTSHVTVAGANTLLTQLEN